MIRHTELTHDHHYRFVWQFALAFLALGALALAITYPFARLPREGQRGFAALVGSATLVMATLSLIAAIDPVGGLGGYEREPADVERSTDAAGTPVVDRSIHVHHLHPPIYVDVPLLLLGIGLLGLSIPNARIAARSRGADEDHPRESGEAAPAPPASAPIDWAALTAPSSEDPAR